MDRVETLATAKQARENNDIAELLKIAKRIALSIPLDEGRMVEKAHADRTVELLENGTRQTREGIDRLLDFLTGP